MSTKGIVRFNQKKWKICPICKREFYSQVAPFCIECKSAGKDKKFKFDLEYERI